MTERERAVASFFAKLASVPDLSYEEHTAVSAEWRRLWSLPQRGTCSASAYEQVKRTRDAMTGQFDAVRTLHKMARGVVWELLAGRRISPIDLMHASPTWYLRDDRLHEVWPLKLSRTTDPIARRVMSSPDVFLLGELISLARMRPFPFRLCPQCETVFVRVRRQQYCTEACASRAFEAGRKDERREYMRTYMAARRKRAAKQRAGRQGKGR